MALLGAEIGRKALVFRTDPGACGRNPSCERTVGGGPSVSGELRGLDGRYERYTTLLDLKRARDGLREGGCSIAKACVTDAIRIVDRLWARSEPGHSAWCEVFASH